MEMVTSCFQCGSIVILEHQSGKVACHNCAAKRKTKMPTAESEHGHQCALFQWAKKAQQQLPELELLYAYPAGGHRHKATAARMKREGAKAGVPDIHLPVARGEYHGLWIELKIGNNKPTQKQKWWLEKLSEQGHLAVVCYGWEEAMREIEKYLGNTKRPGN